jgi:hypothetical protein
MPEWQKAELERRRQEYLKNPEAVISMAELKRSIMESVRKTQTDSDQEDSAERNEKGRKGRH